MKTKLILLLLSISFLWCSCGDKKSKNTAQETSGAATENNISDFEMPSIIDNNVDYKVFKKVEPYLIEIKKHYDTVPYFFVIDTNYYFYIVNGEWTEPSNDTLEKKTQFKAGLVNKFNKPIIPVEYSKIYNPSGTAIGYIEVEKEGKRGLYHISGLKIAPALYDYIYPSPVRTAVAQVRAGDKFGLLASNAEVNYDGDKDKIGFQSPYISKAAQKWEFDIFKNIIHFQPAVNDFSAEEPGGRGVVLTPSYLLELSVAPPIFKYITKSEDVFYGTVKALAGVNSVENWWDDIKTVFTEYYEEGISARDYIYHKRKIYSIDNTGNVKDKLEYEIPHYGFGFGCSHDNTFNIRIVDDTLLEIKRYKEFYSVEEVRNNYVYDFYPYYTYFKLNKNGKFKKLKTNRIYNFTKYTKIDDNYFKGCFAYDVEVDKEGNNIIQSEHLSIEEMELMKNEIFADYDYIFTTPKWKDYFSKQPWYMGLEKNVSDKLTEIDKHNLKIIINTIDKMKPNPDEYTNKKKGAYHAAG